jgi:hypothetical protein
MIFEEYRNQFPAYRDLDDKTLADGIYKKYYAGMMSKGEFAHKIWSTNYKGSIPMGQFADMIGLSQPEFKLMVRNAEESGYKPTGQTYAEGYIPIEAPALLAARGATAGLAENLAAAGVAGIEKMRGSDRPFGELYQQRLEQAQAPMEQAYKVAPGTALATEVVAGIPTGGSLVSIGRQALGKTPVVGGLLSRPIVAAPVAGGAAGFGYGVATSSGTPEERIEAGKEMILPSMFFGAAGQAIANVATPALRRVGFAFDAASRRPSMESLQRAKTAAYDAASDAGVVIPQQEMNDLARISEWSADVNRDFVPATDTYTAAALDTLKKYAGQDVSLMQLDKIRQNMYARYKQSSYSEPAILDIIDYIDDIIERTGPANEVMLAARAANARFKKAQAIDVAFDRAERSAEASGTGGNMVNRYKQVINNLLNNEREIRFFTREEQDLMRQFVHGDLMDSVLRTVGRLDPSSSGLMLALNAGAYLANPASAAVSMAGAASRRGSEGSAMEQASRLFGSMGAGRPLPMPQPSMMPGLIGPSFITEYNRERDKLRYAQELDRLRNPQ